MKPMQAWFTMFVLLAAAGARAQDVTPEARRVADRLAATTCSTCHGTAGRSVSPIFPNLAAQTAPYIEEQLKAFRDQSRADPDAEAYMWGMASQLNDATISALAAHYAAQSPATGHVGDSKSIARGKATFQQGVPTKGIPACATCHGEHAQGNGPFPRLAGQHADYLLKQLLVIQSVLRLAPVMHGVIQNLSRDQMRDVAVYLESIGPTTK
ncbi:MAG TPA: c-type cytochrome [Steroidobacteraceae bacterium]|nr:c-type cytochrome [Steroidobacteraceae bacterium]